MPGRPLSTLNLSSLLEFLSHESNFFEYVHVC